MTLQTQMEQTAITDTTGVTLPEPITTTANLLCDEEADQPALLLDELHERYYRLRDVEHAENHPKTQWGIAAPSASKHFKLPGPNGPTNVAKRWDQTHISQETLMRFPSKLKAAAKHLSKPGLISLGGGLPTSAYFPFQNISITVPSGKIGEFDEASTAKTGKTLESGKHDLAKGKSLFDISTAFNYGQGTGSAQMVRWVTEHTQQVHSPPYKDWACNMTIGSTSALDLSLRMFTERGDSILCENYTFTAAVETMVPLGLKVVGVPLDGQGLIPAELDRIMVEWNERDKNGKLIPAPKVLYTIPSGQNPTGATMTTQRRKDVYKVCQKHDIFILEDEPYYFLQMPEYQADAEFKDESGVSDVAFLKSLVTSFLKLDVDGRVLRMDSFSKVLAPGTRMGWVTASEQIIDYYRMHVDCSTQNPCGFAQLPVFRLLEECWGHGGYLNWLKYIRKEYTIRRDSIVRSAEKHLPRHVASWEAPKAGMFYWIKIDWKKHPQATTLSKNEIEMKIFLATVNEGALVIPGSWFSAPPDTYQEEMFFRATFAAAHLNDIDLAIERFGIALRKEFHCQEETAAN